MELAGAQTVGGETAASLAEVYAGHGELKARVDGAGTPTTWTVLQHDGPNHLGL